MQRFWIFWLALVNLVLAMTTVVSASTVAQPDEATTDDQTPVLIDLTANDYDTTGRPLVVALNTHNCPGNVESLFDGTVLFTPQSADPPVTCTISYTVNGQSSSATLNITEPGGSVGGGGGGCEGSWNSNVLQPSGNGLSYQGQPIYLAGYYPGMHTLSRTSNNSQPPTSSLYYRQLIDALVDRDINLVRTYLTSFSAEGNQGDRHMTPYAQSSSCCTAEPSPSSNVAWGGVNRYDLNQWNNAFFEHWNEVIAYAESRGVMMVVALFENRSTWEWEEIFDIAADEPNFAHGRKFNLLASQNNVNGVGINNASSPEPWYSDPTALSRQTAFAREALKRLGGHDNVIWELANEPPPSTRLNPAVLDTWHDAICAAVRQGEADGNHPRHAIMPRDLREHRDVPGHRTPGDDENFSGVHASLIGLIAAGEGPLIADNDCCFDAGSAAAQRKKAWTSFVSGAHPLLFNFQADDFYDPLVNNTSALEPVFWVGRTRRLVLDKQLDVSLMTPQDALISGGTNVWALAQTGEHYVVYFLQGGTATISSLPNNFEAQWLDPRSGDYSTATATSSNGNSATFSAPSGDDWVLYIESTDTVVPPETSQRPYGGTAHVVGSAGLPVQAEHYDEVVDENGNVVSGAGEAYHDSTPGNGNGASSFRPDEDVDVLISGRTYVNQTTNGEWLEYSLNVAEAGHYALHAIYATRIDAGDGSLRLDVYNGDTVETTQTVTLTNTNDADADLDWANWVHCAPFPLSAGPRTLRLTFTGATFHLDTFQLVPAATSQSPYGDGPRLLPGVVEAEHFDTGATAGYCDTTPQHLGVTFRDDTWVDITNGGGSRVIAWAEPGEWLEYTVLVEAAGSHDVEVTYATLGAGLAGRAKLEVINGSNVEDSLTFDLPVNGAPGPYEDLLVGQLNLPQGERVLRWQVLEPGFAFGKLRIGDDAPPPVASAVDDSFFFVSDETLTLDAVDLLGNDEPRGEVEIDPTNPIETYPAEGNLTWNAATDQFVYQAPGNMPPSQTFEYRMRVIGHPNVTAVGQVTLFPLGNAPVAVDDDFSMPPGTTLSIYPADLMDNDSGAHTHFGGIVQMIPGLVQASASPLTFEYTPPFSSGSASFQYWNETFTNVPSNNATVTITVSPSAGRPVANDDDFYMAQQNLDGSTPELEIFWSYVLQNDVAANGGDLSVFDFTNPDHFSSFQSTIVSWKYTPPANWQGTASFNYRPEESGIPAEQPGAEAGITVVPAPVGVADIATTPFNTPLTLAYSTDLAGNDQGYGAALEVLSDSLTLPLHGSLDTSVEGRVTYIPPTDWSGTDSFTYVVANDLDGVDPNWKTRSEPVTVTITVLPSDVAAADDQAFLRQSVNQLDIPLAHLFANDSPAGELVLVGHGQGAVGSVQQAGDVLRYVPGSDFQRYGVDQFTYTVRRFGGNANASAEATVYIVGNDAYVAAFADDFEAPDLSLWDRVQVDAGHSVTPSLEAALRGVQGLDVNLDGSGDGAYVESTDAEFRDASHVAVSFDLDLSRLTMAEGNHHTLLYTSLGNLSMARQNGVYLLRSWIRRQPSGLTATGWIPLSGDTHRLRVEWQAASAPGQLDGSTRLWVDDVLLGEVHGVDNDAYRASVVRLGAIWGVDAGTSGSMSFDAVDVRRGPFDRPFLIDDDFASGHLGQWSGVVEVGGTAGLSADQRLAVSPGGFGSVASLYADMAPNVTHYGARFTLDPGSLLLPDGQHFFLFGATGSGSWTSNVRLLNQAGQLQVALVSTQDNSHANSGWHDLGSGPQDVEWEWWAASGPGEDDGGQRLWINGVLMSEITGLDNDLQFADRVNVGAVAALDDGTSGTFFLDDVAIWQGRHQRAYLAEDDFETGIAVGAAETWSHQVEVGGSLSAQSVGAFGNSQGLAVQLDEGVTTVHLQDTTPDRARSYHAHMRWQAGDLSIWQGEFILLGGVGDAGGWTVSLRLGVISGELYVRAVATNDSGLVHTGWFLLGDLNVAHDLGVDWQAASTPTSQDGRLRLWIDGQIVRELTGLDNDTRNVDKVHLGADGNIQFGTAGTFYIDHFVSWQ